MKVKVEKYIGPNTVVGKSGGKLVRARVPVNARPQTGEEVDIPESEVGSYTEPKEEKSEDGTVKVPDSAPPKK